MGFAFRSSPFRGTTFAVHLAIADSVNDQNGNEMWMSRQTVADKARVSLSAAKRALKELVGGGYLAVAEENIDKPNRYVFLFPEKTSAVVPEGGSTVSPGGFISNQNGGSPRTPNPSTATQGEPKDLSLAEPASEQNVLFVALCEATGRDPTGMPAPEKRSTSIAMEALRKAGATPAEISTRAANYRSHYPDAALTPHALVLHWSLCRQPKANRNGDAVSTRTRQLAAQLRSEGR